MAGECLSYGAFGAYNTKFHRQNKLHGSYEALSYHGRKVDSWKNFLPDVAKPLAEHEAEYQASQVKEPYDHDAHAGIKDFNPEVTWVVKRYTPLDERTYAPVPRFKYILRPSSVPPPAHWIPPRADSASELIKFSRQRQEKHAFHSQPYTRDERWSTLREMLPSSGRAIRTHPPDWGSLHSVAPEMSSLPQKRFPIIDSPMSRFVSNMHLTNREFKLF